MDSASDIRYPGNWLKVLVYHRVWPANPVGYAGTGVQTGFRGKRYAVISKGNYVVKKFLISLLLVMPLISVNVMADTSGDDQVPKPVITQVERDTGGRVLSAVVTDKGYQLKVLMPGGVVRIIEVPRQQ